MMNRRQALLSLAAVGAVAAGVRPNKAHAQLFPVPLTTGHATSSLGIDIYYHVYGNPTGPNLFLTAPCYASLGLFYTTSYLPYFVDRYKVLVADYPYGTGLTPRLASWTQLTVEQVCSDYLAIADAAGMSQFAFSGYSFGGSAAQQLATRTNRLTAVALGGWPALGAPHAELLAICSALSAVDFLDLTNVRMNVAYYQSLQSWPEYPNVSALTMPRLNYVDAQDVTNILGHEANMIARFRENRGTLDSLGWTTTEVSSGGGHSGGQAAHIACPVIRSFLDTHL
jgi:pimeloyl-ACP methyl ester carboxylesterase